MGITRSDFATIPMAVMGLTLVVINLDSYLYTRRFADVLMYVPFTLIVVASVVLARHKK